MLNSNLNFLGAKAKELAEKEKAAAADTNKAAEKEKAAKAEGKFHQVFHRFHRITTFLS